MKGILILGGMALFCAVAGAQTLHGPNVNPSNLAVLVEWEKFTGRQADIIGDNLSADSWAVFREAPSYREEGQKSAIAEQLRRWQSAFDGNGILEEGEGAEPYLGQPLGSLSDYAVELALPMFPNRMLNQQGELVASSTVGDRWQMGDRDNRHHREAKKAFQALAVALVDSGMAEAHLRLAWEFTGDWFPWGIDPNGGESMGTAADFKACWKFIYLAMEEVNPKFQWVWNATVGFDHFDPREAFPHYPEERFSNYLDNEDKTLVDFISADIYDADGECYYRVDNPEDEGFEFTPGFWNRHEEERKLAFEHFRTKVFEGRGNRAEEGESATYGLRYFKELADEKELPLVISEWGPWANYVPQRNSKEGKFLRSGAFGGDDHPEFIDAFFKWMEENEIGYAALFEFYNGGEGDIVDHTLVPGYWNTPREGRPRVSLYPEGSPFAKVTDQLHPRAAQAYLRNLNEAQK